MAQVKEGDYIICKGMKVVIGKILFSDFYKGFWEIEFLDNKEKYRYWKQVYDSGTLVQSN